MTEREVYDIYISIPGVEEEEKEIAKKGGIVTEYESYDITIPTEVAPPAPVAAPTVTKAATTTKTTKVKLPTWFDNVSVQELADMLAYILLYFKIRSISISFEPRDFPPVVQPEVSE